MVKFEETIDDKFDYEFKTERDCRRKNYQIYINDSPYCTKNNESCIYRDDTINSNLDMYKCRLLYR
jgi:hypothetical protein